MIDTLCQRRQGRTVVATHLKCLPPLIILPSIMFDCLSKLKDVQTTSRLLLAHTRFHHWIKSIFIGQLTLVKRHVPRASSGSSSRFRLMRRMTGLSVSITTCCVAVGSGSIEKQVELVFRTWTRSWEFWLWPLLVSLPHLATCWSSKARYSGFSWFCEGNFIKGVTPHWTPTKISYY